MRRETLLLAIVVATSSCVVPYAAPREFGTPCASDDDCSSDYQCDADLDACVPVLNADAGAPGDGGFVEGGCATGGETLTAVGDEIALLGCTGAVEGSLILEQAVSLSTLQGVTDIEGDLIIRDSPNLTSLEGLEQLFSVGGRFVLEDTNARLDALDILSGVEGGLELRNNNTLDSLSPLLLTSLADLVIEANPGLTDLNDPRLPLDIGSLTIKDNPNLVSLNGLEELRTIVNLEITGNPLLTDVSALCGLTTGLVATGGITGDTAIVTNNASLPNYEARCISADKIAGERLGDVELNSIGNLDTGPGGDCACN